MAVQFTERQHFIPRTYLKQFADKKDSGHYNVMALPVNDLRVGAIIERNSKSICYEKHIYTLPGATVEEKMLVETFYSEALESKYQDVYTLLTNPAKNELSAAERELVVSTVATMLYRVPIWRNQNTDVMRRVFGMAIQATNQTGQENLEIEGDAYVIEGKTADQLIKEYLANNKARQIVAQLNIALKLVTLRMQRDNVYIYKLEDGDQQFLTSDNPVVLQNLNGLPIAPFNPSNIIKLPLDPKHYLMLMPNNNQDNLHRIQRQNATGGFSRREELISNTEQMQQASEFIIGSTASLTRFLNIKDTDIPLANEEQELLDKLLALGNHFGWFNIR
jgi:Protein of unknown function (DUF4238)